MHLVAILPIELTHRPKESLGVRNDGDGDGDGDGSGEMVTAIWPTMKVGMVRGNTRLVWSDWSIGHLPIRCSNVNIDPIVDVNSGG